MSHTIDVSSPPPIATIVEDGRRFVVTCRVNFDGVEHVGRLWFDPEDRADTGIPDRGAIPGRDAAEVIALARRLSVEELILRYRRAMSEKRRFVALRKVTDEILTKIRYMNQLAISMNAGLIDREGAAQEMTVTEQQIHDCVTRLRDAAGIQS